MRDKVVKFQVFQATFLEGNGERPPEDVGGETGFEEYLNEESRKALISKEF